MRNLSKLSEQSRKHLSSLTCVNHNLITVGLAKVLADKMTLPNSPVENLEEFYKTNIETANYNTFAYIGELLVLNYNEIDDHIRIFWKMRYEILYFANDSLIAGQDVFDFLGIKNNLSTEQIEFIEQNAKELCRIYNKFTIITRDIDNRILENGL